MTMENAFIERNQIICDIAAGLSVLHSLDVVHNDIKPGNVLLFSSTQPGREVVAKISDFGCAVPLAVHQQMKGLGATLVFAAPEAYLSDCPVLPSRDVYSFGLLIFSVLTGKPPLADISADRHLELKGNKDQMHQYVSDGAQEYVQPCVTSFLLRLLDPNPDTRLSASLDVQRFFECGVQPESSSVEMLR
jgi:serine/threonine protein kinase